MNIRTLTGDLRSRFQMVRAMFSLLSPRQKRSYRLFVVWMFCSSLIEIFTLGIFVFFLKVMTAPDLLISSSWGNTFRQITGFISVSESVIVFGCMLFLLFLFKNWVTYAMFSSFNRFVYEIAASLSEEKLREYFSLDFLEVEKRNTSEYARRIIHVPIEFSQHIVLGSMVILSEILLVTLLSITVLVFNPSTFLLTIGFFLPFIALTRFISIRKLRSAKKMIHSLSENNSKVLSDTLNSYVDAKIYRKEEYFIHRYSGMQETLNKELALLNSINTLPAKLSEVFLICALVIILIISHSSGNIAGITTIAAIFVAFLYRAVPSVNKILTLWSNAHTYAATITMLQPFLKSSPLEPMPQDVVDDVKFLRTLELQNISFTYQDRNIQPVNKVSLTIHKGDVIGIVGKSGSGKTTILRLLLRLLNPLSGVIVMDGSPAETKNKSSWQSLFAFVNQSPFLMHDTIEANVAFGEKPEDIDRNKVMESLNLVGLKDFVLQLPDRLLTNIGERGKQLSGGQKQRLVIARALYRNAEIFIFDEATSELDNISELEIVDTIRALQKNGKTIIIASHHESALVPCSVIFELNNGKLVQRTKQSLVQRKKKKK